MSVVEQGAADLTRREVAAEQGHADQAYARLDELRAEAGRQLAEAQASRPFNDQAVYERDVFAHAAASRRAELDAADEGLLFGRTDAVDGTVLRIGRIGVRSADLDPLVVDWRAPAAASFYRATAVEPLGLGRRRTITMRGRRVTAVNDELLDSDAGLEGSSVVGEGAFLAALARERGPHMRDIAATIAREQDEVIRAPDDGAVVVTGGPGTGKTAVALHRVAYLMYAHRERYARRGVLVVGPSDVFVRYISQVLPALGETSATLASLGELVPGQRALRTDPPLAAQAKGSLAMVGVLRRAVRRAGTAVDVPPLRVAWRGQEVRVAPSTIQARRRELAGTSRGHNAQRRHAASALGDLVWSAWLRAAGAADWRPDTRAALREELAYHLAQDRGFRAALDAMWPVLRARDVLDALRRGELDLDRLARGELSGEQVLAVQDAWASAAAARDAGEPADPDEPVTAPLTVADVALLDELADLLGEVPPGDPYGAPEEDVDPEPEEVAEVTTYADRTSRGPRRAFTEGHRGYVHVVVDEAQDVSPLQWRMLGRRGRGASWTVVGDWAQSSWTDPEEVRVALDAAVGRRRVRSYELTTNYRTTGAVAELAGRVLRRVDATLAPPRAVRDRGDEVAVRAGVDDLAGVVRAAAEELLAAVPGTVGVIAPHTLATQVREWLAGQDVAADGARRPGPADPRLAVVDPWQAKGLEYDGCVLVAPEALVAESAAGTRALYVAVTRATRRLVVVSRLEDPWPDLLGDASGRS